MTIVHVQTGAFRMGSSEDDENERPVHIVGRDALWIGRVGLTNGQYRRLHAAAVCDPPRESGSQTRVSHYGDSAYDDCPVIYVS